MTKSKKQVDQSMVSAQEVLRRQPDDALILPNPVRPWQWFGFIVIALVVGACAGIVIQHPIVSRLVPWVRPSLVVTGDRAVATVVEKREVVNSDGEIITRRLLEDAQGRVVRFMKNGSLLGMGTLIGDSGWVVTPIAPDDATVVFADGREVKPLVKRLNSYINVWLVQINASGVHPYKYRDAAMADMVGTHVVLVAPRDGFGAPFAETRMVRGLYAGADINGLFPIAHATRRFDIGDSAPFVGMPAVDLNGALVGVADARGRIIPAGLLISTLSALHDAPDTFMKKTVRYRPLFPTTSGGFGFEIYNDKGKKTGMLTGESLGAQPGDDLAEIIARHLAKDQIPTNLLSL